MENKSYFVGFIITLPIFIGYACCFALQKDLSKVFGLTEGISGDRRAYIYGIGTSFVYFFNLIFRIFGHNLVFGFLSPKNRVIAALTSCCISMTMLTILSIQKSPPSLAWVFISYAFMGVAEGSYGPNMLNIVNNLGNTRLFVVLAMPTGIACINMGAFALIALGVPLWIFYLANAVFTVIMIVVFCLTIYRICDNNDIATFDIHAFLADCKEIKEWFPKIWLHALCFIANMFCISLFNPGCTLYAYPERVHFRILGVSMDQHWFIFIYNLGGFAGDYVSRKIMDEKKIVNPLLYFLMLCMAVVINLSLIPEVAPVASFFFMWADGGLYTQSTKKMGMVFKERYHLTATSTWLFFGDVGSTTGANVVQLIRPWIDSLKKSFY